MAGQPCHVEYLLEKYGDTGLSDLKSKTLSPVRRRLRYRRWHIFLEVTTGHIPRDQLLSEQFDLAQLDGTSGYHIRSLNASREGGKQRLATGKNKIRHAY